MFYKALKVVVRAVFFSLFRVKIIGRENLKIDGKAIVYANHVAAIDPIFIHCMLDRMPRFMAKQEAFKNPIERWIITKLGAFPVDRDHTDLTAVKTAFRVLSDGGILGIFPEGRRTTDGKMGPFMPGAAMIAVRTNAPMVPIYISRRMKPFCRTYFVVGKPYNIREKLAEVSDAQPDTVIAATEIAKNEIIKLKEQLESECQK